MFFVESWDVEQAPYEFKFHPVQRVTWNDNEWKIALERLPGHNRRLRFRRSGGPLLSGGIFKQCGRETEQDQMKRRFIECLNNGACGRELHLGAHFELRTSEEAGCYALSLSPDGSGYLVDQDWWNFPFRWKAIDLTQISAQDLMAHLEGEPDFLFTRDFIQMSEDERWQQAWKWKNGDHHELKQVMTWAFLGDELWQNETDLQLRLDFNKNGCSLKLLGPPDPLHGQCATLLLSDALYDALSMAINHFKATPNQAHGEQHEVLLQLLETDFWHIDIHLQNPTAHERIEAAFQWRQWLAKHERAT